MSRTINKSVTFRTPLKPFHRPGSMQNPFDTRGRRTAASRVQRMPPRPF